MATHALPCGRRGAMRVPLIHHNGPRARREADDKATAKVIAVPLRVAHIGVWCAAENLVEGEDRAKGLPVEDEAADPEGHARELNVCSSGAINSARREGECHVLERRERRRAEWAVAGDLTP